MTSIFIKKNIPSDFDRKKNYKMFRVDSKFDKILLLC